LALLARAPARVIRGGVELQIDPGEIVQGDYLALERGEQVAADGHLVRADRLEIDESLLTGEAEPAEKRTGDQILSGSFCVAGSGVYVAEHVGLESYAQNITIEGRRFRSPRTPLQQMLDRVLRVLLAVIVGLSLLQIAGFVLQGAAPLDAIRATAVMVTLVPQGLLLMSTVAYSLGALRVAREGALAQILNAVESLAHVDTLCIDKTGTLTTGQLILREIMPVGFKPEASGERVAEVRTLLGRYAASVADPTGTIEALAKALQASPCPVVSTVEFSSERKWSALTFAAPCQPGPFVLGAPEVLLPQVPNGTGLAETVARREAEGERVLLFAAVPPGQTLRASDGTPRLPYGLQALAIVALEEGLRPDAPETLAAFAAQGVTLKLISGDSPKTVLALAGRAGFPAASSAISGAELSGVPPEQFSEVVERTAVFGRVTPQQKREIIRALKARGRYVAMVGDGVNDVLALKEANLGIAMRSGSSATRAAADVVLLNDSFAALPAVLQAGRQIINGLRLALRLFLVRDVATIELIVASSFVRAPFPLFPPHAALIAFLTVGLPAFFVVGWAGKSPRAPDLRADAAFVLWVGAAYALAVLTAYMLAFTGFEADVTQARTTVVTTAVVSGLLVLLILDHPLDAPVYEYLADHKMLVLVGVLLLVYLCVLYLPPFQRYFELAPLHPFDWLVSLPPVIFWFGALRLQARYRLAQRLLG
ncbi:MAG: HAD-IC family P-type ATPase, partial [Chloroflexota bacterium]